LGRNITRVERKSSTGLEPLRPQGRGAAPASVPEVEFALVINRMIDSIKTDPEHLRATIYELARHKLKEQFAAEPDIDRLSDALEVAIRGVEAFTINKDQGVLTGPQVPRLAAPQVAGLASNGSAGPGVMDPRGFARPRKSRWYTAPVRLLVVLAIVLAVVVTARRAGVSIDGLQKSGRRVAWLLGGPAPKALADLPQATAALPPPQKSPLTPTSYGVYAISEDKLYELELLPGRAPDPRVAISAAILTPSRTTLPDGHLKFVVFRRDSATSAADRAEIRVVAKIGNETTFDAAGKPVVKKADDAWVIRNISIPYRTAPKKEDPDMYEVQSENPETALTPGRYALVLKGQAYDFSVAGSVTDPNQCLERMAATNGQFYSACQKP
jgi:hypothetical protein